MAYSKLILRRNSINYGLAFTFISATVTKNTTELISCIRGTPPYRFINHIDKSIDMANKLKQRIRIQIGAMGGDEFESFMSDLLPKIYPGFNVLEPTFNLLGKATKGKCDAHVYHSSDDIYTAIICTSQQSDIRSKVLEDIQKLTATKFSSKISRVMLCVNTALKDEVDEYRIACRAQGWELDPQSLETITRYTLGHADLLEDYFGELNPNAGNTLIQLRRFDCGDRLKEARSDVSLSVSQLIEGIDFPSEKTWVSIESKEMEITERHIHSFSVLTGISSIWLKHGMGAKYPHQTIYSHETDWIEAIHKAYPLRTYMAIEPLQMHPLLIVQFTELRWGVYDFNFNMNFWDWIDDHSHIPRIFEMLKTIDRDLGHPHGRIISRNVSEELIKKNQHLSVLLKKMGENSYWFDDLFDVQHRYPIAKDKYRHHGDWFVQLQKQFI